MTTPEDPVIYKSTLDNLSTIILDFKKDIDKLYQLFFNKTITFSEDGSPPFEGLEPDYKRGHSKVDFRSYANRWSIYILDKEIENVETEIKENILTAARDGNEYAYLSKINTLVGQWQTIRNTTQSSINQIAKLYDLSIDDVSVNRFRILNLRLTLSKQLIVTKTYTQKRQKISYIVYLRRQIIHLVDWIYKNFQPVRALLREHFGHWPISGEFAIPQIDKLKPEPPKNTLELAERALNTLYNILPFIDSVIEVVRQAVSTSILLVQYPSQFSNIVSETCQMHSADQELELDKGLSAAQKVLFIRLLQEKGLFPKKLYNTDDAPELRAIALLTGLSFENQIKGGKGATVKVNQLLNDYERKKLTQQQAKPKLDDLNAVENVARLLNVEPVITRIDQLRKEINKILGN